VIEQKEPRFGGLFLFGIIDRAFHTLRHRRALVRSSSPRAAYAALECRVSRAEFQRNEIAILDRLTGKINFGTR